ncbi:MAG: YlqD family protein [Thermoanaerobacteraceae bacterium]|nr:YlqD family protein [Thermoanaerobacteraceae bacterium]
MEQITITRPVVIKVRVTENYKRQLAGEIQEAIARLDVQMQHLEFQARRLTAEMERKDPRGVPAIRQKIEQERSGRLETRQKLLDKLKEITCLTPGEEIIHGRVESIVDIKRGDHWQQIMDVEIVLEDWVVKEIRSGGRNVPREG